MKELIVSPDAVTGFALSAAAYITDRAFPFFDNLPFLLAPLFHLKILLIGSWHSKRLVKSVFFKKKTFRFGNFYTSITVIQ